MTNEVISRIEWVRGQIGLEWKIDAKVTKLDQKGYDYHEKRVVTISSINSQKTRILLQSTGRFWRGKSEDFWDETSYTDRSTCVYKLQIIPKKEKEFVYGTREVDNESNSISEADLELKRLYEQIMMEN